MFGDIFKIVPGREEAKEAGASCLKPNTKGEEVVKNRRKSKHPHSTAHEQNTCLLNLLNVSVNC